MTAMTSISTDRPVVRNNMPPESATLAEERREVFESVLVALANDPLDADRVAAGSHLLRHLSRTATPAPWLV